MIADASVEQFAAEFEADVADVVKRAKELAARVNKTIKRLEALQATDAIDPDDLEEAWSELDAARDDQYALVAAALGWRYDPTEIRGWHERAVIMGAVHPTIGPQLLRELMMGEKVPVTPIRDWIENSGMSTVDALTQVGEDDDVKREERHLRRNFGYGTQSGRNDIRCLTLFAPYELVAAAARVLGIDPYEIGV